MELWNYWMSHCLVAGVSASTALLWGGWNGLGAVCGVCGVSACCWVLRQHRWCVCLWFRGLIGSIPSAWLCGWVGRGGWVVWLVFENCIVDASIYLSYVLDCCVVFVV